MCPERFQRSDGSPSGTRHIQVGHEGEGHGRLVLAQCRVITHLGLEPVAEVRCRLDDPTPKEVGARVDEVGGDREQPAQRLDTYSHLWPDSEGRTREAVDPVLGRPTEASEEAAK